MRSAVLPLLLVAVACQTNSVGFDQVAPSGLESFALEPYPTPREARLEDRLRPFDLQSVRFSALPGRPAGSFTIHVTEGGIEVAATNEDARRWALFALRQMSVDDGDGERWVRMGRIRDRPGFPLRGSKRLMAWEIAYRANLSYGRSFPEVVTVAVYSPGGVLDATEVGVDRVAEFFLRGSDAGVRRFAIEFDDVAFGLTDETKDRYGSYPRSLVRFMTECRAALLSIDPDAILYWLPQTYWTDCEHLTTFANDIGMAGGLPREIGLVLTGPDVISEEIHAADLTKARRAFGLDRTKVLVYDNRGREGDHGPLRGRGPDLLAGADSVFGERGEPLNRLTRLDYLWNPIGYDPDRSHLLACREIVGAAAAVPLTRFIREGPGLSATERLLLFSETLRLLDPPIHAPVGAADYLPRIWRDVSNAASKPVP